MWSLHLGRGSSPKPLQLLCKPRAQLQHGPNLVVDPCELSRSRRDHRLHAGVRPRATGPIVRMPGRKRVEGEETLDLAEGESQLLSLPDDREALDVAFGVLSVSGVGPACRRQDAAAFVEADRPHADSAPPGEFADEHAPLSWLPVTSLHFAGKHSERGESSPRWTTAIAPRELYHSRRRGGSHACSPLRLCHPDLRGHRLDTPPRGRRARRRKAGGKAGRRVVACSRRL